MVRLHTIRHAGALGTCVSMALLLCAVVGVRVARADEGIAEGITWSAPSCPPQWKLQARVEHLLGRPLSELSSPPIRVKIETDVREGFVLRLSVRLDDGEKQRELYGADCDQLVDAAALVIALLLDPDLEVPVDQASADAAEEGVFSSEMAAQVGDAREPADEAKVPRSASSPLLAETEQNSESEPARQALQKEWLVGVGALVDFATLGGIAGGATVELHYRIERVFSARGTFVVLPQRRIGESVGGDFSLYAGGLDFCGQLEKGRVLGALCLGMEAGIVRGRALGESTDAGSGRWLTPVTSLELGLRLGRWEAVFASELLLPLYREEFFSQGQAVYQIPVVSGRMSVVARFRFP